MDPNENPNQPRNTESDPGSNSEKTPRNTTPGYVSSDPYTLHPAGTVQPTGESQSEEDRYAKVITGNAGLPRKSKKKKLLLSGILVLVLLLVAGGVVFGYYLPNKPENIWDASLNRTGEALNSVTVSATEKNKLEAMGRSQITASAEKSGNGGGFSATFKTTFDKSKADGSLDVTSQSEGQPDEAFSAKFLSELKEGSTYPSLYFQLTNFKALGLEGLELGFPGINEYDGKWIAIEEEYLRSLAEQAMAAGQAAPNPETQKTKEETVTADDIAAFARALSGATQEYILTADPNKAVLERRSFVGKETVEGIKTYHYKAGINKTHAKDFCKAMTERVWETEAYKKLLGAGTTDEQRADSKKKSIESCQKSVDNMKQERTFDIWMDSKYKLVHKIRFTDEEKKNNYTEIGQNYKGGDQLSLFVATHDADQSSDGKLTLDVNLKTNETKASFTQDNTSAENSSSLKASLAAKPFKEEIKIEKPAGAIPIQSIFERYQFDPAMLMMLGAAAVPGEGGEAVEVETTTPLPAMYTN